MMEVPSVRPLIFCSPLLYVQGPDLTDRLADELESVGLSGPALVVAGNRVIGLLAPRWAESFASRGWVHRVRVFGGECTQHEVEQIVLESESLQAAVLIGCGGGKVLDAVRAAAAARKVPFVSCPTVASTDAPTSALSVIYRNDGSVDSSFIHKRNPDLVLVDSRVIAHSPPRFFASGIGDAMSTWYEAASATASNSPTMRGGRATGAAVALARLCRDIVFADGVEALDDCRHNRVTPALERVIEAATLLSGLGFESAGLAAAHAVHNGLCALSQTHSLLHGEKVAFGTLVHLALEQTVLPTLERSVEIDRLAHFFIQIGLPVTLEELHVPDLDASRTTIAARATIPTETMHNMPFHVDASMVAAAIVVADAAGRKAHATTRIGL